MVKCVSYGRFIFLLLFLTSSFSYAFERGSQDIGLQLNYGLLYNDADFRGLPGIPNCCPLFSTSTGRGYMLDLYYDYPLYRDLSLNLGLSFGYNISVFTATEKTSVFYNGETVEGAFEHTMSTFITDFSVNPAIYYNFWDRLSFGAGLRIGSHLYKNYSQKETISEPADAGTFLDENGEDSGKRTRNEYSGSMPVSNNVFYSVDFSLRYELPLNRDGSLTLIPNVTYEIGLNDYLAGLKWKQNSVHFGLSVAFEVVKPKYYGPGGTIEEPPVQDTFTTKDLVLRDVDENITESRDTTTGKFKKTELKFVYDTTTFVKRYETVTETEHTDTIGVEDKDAKVIVRLENFRYSDIKDSAGFKAYEYESGFAFPMLNYIFFDQGSSKIPPRYITDKKDLDTGQISPDKKFEIYYDMLNIIGSKAKEYNSGLTLTAPYGFDKNENEGMAVARAETIRNYLVSQWGLPGDKIKIKTVDFSARTANQTPDPKKEAEYRRVEIKPDNWKVIEPVLSKGTSFKYDPSDAIFGVKTSGKLIPKGWDFTVDYGRKFKRAVEGSKAPPGELIWKLDKAGLSPLGPKDSIKYAMNVKDENGNEYISSGKFTIDFLRLKSREHYALKDKTIDSYYLILFDLNSSEISPENRKALELIKKHIKKNSQVSIYGYTDEIGDPDYNYRLSLDRAKATAEALGIPGCKIGGYGGQVSLYDNDAPEGRFYSRTVEIRVTTSRD